MVSNDYTYFEDETPNLALFDLGDGIICPAYLYSNIKPDDNRKRRTIYLMHGAEGNAERLIRSAIAAARACDMPYLLVAPEIKSSRSAFVNLGNMCHSARNRSLFPKSEWTFSWIDSIHAAISSKTCVEDFFYLFGHSAGAQFVHRYVLFNDSSRMKLAVAANAGWYTAFDEQIFPYGVADIAVAPRVFNKQLIVLLGKDDVNTDKYLRTTDRAFVQGANRLERGKYFYGTARNYANKRELDFRWKVDYIDGVSHDSRRMIQEALQNYLLVG